MTRRSSSRHKAERQAPGIVQRPWKQLTYRLPPTTLLSADEVDKIHETALTILRDIGMVATAKVS